MTLLRHNIHTNSSKRSFEQTLRTRLSKIIDESFQVVIKPINRSYRVTLLIDDRRISVGVRDFSSETGKAVFEKFKKKLEEE